MTGTVPVPMAFIDALTIVVLAVAAGLFVSAWITRRPPP